MGGDYALVNTKISPDMHILSFNVRSILSFERRTLFANFVHEGNYDIICLSETWLVPEVSDEALFLTNRTIYRADRLSSVIKTKHGGVLIGIKPSISHELVQLDATFEESLVIRVNASQHFLICGLYNPPVNSHFRWKRDKLISLLNELKSKQADLDCKFVVITGDLNFSKTSWDSMESTDDYEQSILDVLCEQGFKQILEHNNEKFLDVFLCNDDENLYISKEDKQIASRYNVSDHPAYITTIQLTVNRWIPVKLQQVYSLKSANWESFVTAILENPFQPYCYSNVDVLLQTWYSWFYGIMEDNLKKVTKHRMSQPSWTTSKTSHL